MIYSFVCLILCLLTWFNTFQRADVLRVGNRTELVMSTLACSLGVFASLIGWAGILLNNRSFLAVYTSLLWVVFIFILFPGYVTYKRRTFNLEGKINAQWSQALGVTGRLRIQNELGCCGYFSPFVEATVSSTCYARSILPGCKLAYMSFEKTVLRGWYTVAFLLAFVHIAVMVAGLLCSNHVTYRFGKGMMPKAYRLSLTSMAIIMEAFARCVISLSSPTFN
jgi:multisubunit Na+/H+ antiporter MnhG subunit